MIEMSVREKAMQFAIAMRQPNNGAAKIVRDATLIAEFLEPGSMGITDDTNTTPRVLPISELRLTTRARRVLLRAKIRDTAQLTRLKPSDLLKLDGLGGTILGQIRYKLAAVGLSLVAEEPAD